MAAAPARLGAPGAWWLPKPSELEVGAVVNL